MNKPALLALALLIVAVGCAPSGGDDGLKKEDVQAASRVDQIAKASGGDWSKVSDKDKKYLVDEVSMGSEKSAQMLLMAKSGKLQSAPGGKTTSR
jgi:hypothetical protein